MFQFLLLLIVSIGFGNAANILYIDGVASPSHFIWHRALMYGLAAKGHNVTALSVDVELKPPPNVTFIKVEGVYEAFHENNTELTDFLSMTDINPFSMLYLFSDYVTHGCEFSLKSKGLQQILDYPKDFKFDLIINDYLQGPCMVSLAQHKFGRPPLIAATAFHGLTTTTSMSGAYSYSGMVPNHEFDAPERMTYFQRFMNFFYNHWEELLKDYQVTPAVHKLVRQVMPDIPYVGEFEKDTRIVLLNSNPIIQYSEPSMPEPSMPNVISVGGLQIIKPKELPADIKSVVEKSTNGVILFSLGTNIRSDLLGNKRIIEILSAMKQFPQYQFLWKFESDSMPIEVPENVYIRKWMPQNDLLAHPNVKLFITHSGLLSTQEAIWHGVPIIGFPVFADQNRNINYCSEMGVGKRLSIANVNRNDLANAIREVMTDKRYRNNMARLSKLFRDQKEHPLDRAIWWVEWVLRNPDNRILQSNAINLSWFVKYSFDVIVPCLLLLVAVSVLVCKIIRKVSLTKVKPAKSKHE
ncbi:UDP-glucosyltransferase 2-like [Sabethes cyaneus]|uniref:UDP-glucosyltransferase 2-like n=1 Tax=Sabethes cyaneus TaxID=53552 RepID=UPI00237D5B74|nr:UDP-glucosyltransferase 2-like [Sabethes cyaneus]